ncbi:MauE/DoxX family redox-associated membrane protein [Mucilaginibacter angelicae]|uniref:MauE/DoxX family redox-associated membrane protein n=1 Tax=Mucilaginibacter angelicae TaxID=869718 RepID=A0ABV6L069_9SPHI
MEKGTDRFLKYAAGLISLLWFYAAVSKLLNFQYFEEAMHKQPLGGSLQTLLIYGLPPVEVLAGILLIVRKTMLPGLYISAVLFLIFTIYTGLILFRFFHHIPCACGGLIEHMGWKFHLGFNITFLALSAASIIIFKRKEAGDI